MERPVPRDGAPGVSKPRARAGVGARARDSATSSSRNAELGTVVRFYASDPFAYDFKAAVDEALSALDGRRRLLSHARTDESVFWKRAFPKAPTVERLHKHAAKFDAEGVKEIADAYAIDFHLKKTNPEAPKKARRTNDELRRQVVDLRARGLRTAVIADTLNVSDRRVQEIVRSAEMREAA
jgi:hypothetical protein